MASWSLRQTVFRYIQLLLWGASCWVGALSAAPVFEALTAFEENGSDLKGPLTRMDDGTCYAIQSSSGPYYCGTIIKIDPTDGAITPVVDFTGTGGPHPGTYPNAPLWNDGQGLLWGSTQSGGANNAGTVFKLDVAGGAVTTVIEFSYASSSGAAPNGGLTPDTAGYLWGTTAYGGTDGHGTVFKLNPQTGELSTIVRFTSNGTTNRGAIPTSGLFADGTGFLWGTTSRGGVNDCGTVFKIDQTTGVLTTLSEFTGSSGSNHGVYPKAGLIGDGAGNLWGTTEGGIANGGGLDHPGTVFKVNLATGILTTVVDFTGKTGVHLGSRPLGLVNVGNGMLWGVTIRGGTYDGGTLFKVAAVDGTMTTVVEFGLPPSGELVSDGAGNVLGTTAWGGVGRGTVFKVAVDSGKFTTVVSVPLERGPNRGLYPLAGFAADDAGTLWGTTVWGGAYASGTVFKFDPNGGQLTTVLEFTSNGPVNRGNAPYATLLNDGAGYLWGTTYQGGASNLGTVFKIEASSGVLTTVADFTGTDGANRGANPYSGLAADGTGSLWGTTFRGGFKNGGTVYKIDLATGALSTVVDFDLSSGGFHGLPVASLVSDGAGFMWGTTSVGGVTNCLGTVFKINVFTGELATVAEFQGSPLVGGASPFGALVRDPDGNFWGTTSSGGEYWHGTIFKLDPVRGLLRTVVDFTSDGPINRGAQPLAGLALDAAGYLWGTTSDGGAGGHGTIFRIDRSTGVLSTQVEFTNSSGDAPGRRPQYGSLLPY